MSRVSTAPTVIADGALPGDVIPRIPRPRIRVGSKISCRRDDDDPRAHGSFDRLHERIGRARLVDRMAEGEVDDVDLQAFAVLNRELNRIHHIARQTCAIALKTFKLMMRAFGAMPR